MKYYLLGTREFSDYNVGDYIQALASSQFLPHIDGFLNREELSLYRGDDCMVVMNAWYMDNTDNWPPSEHIIPLFISVHFNSQCIDRLTSEKGFLYLKDKSPIGCRDLFTCEYLQKKGIDAYFSGCMTLTLGKNYLSSVKGENVYFVDPLVEIKWSIVELSKLMFFIICNLFFVFHVFIKFEDRHNHVKRFIRVAKFCREYSKYFTKRTLVDAEYICHIFSKSNDLLKTHFERLGDAEKLVRKYAKASLVVTSRIHCALPCLGLETPVIFIDNSNSEESSNCRFKGLKELFNIISWDGQSLTSHFKLNDKIDYKSNIPVNKTDWHEISEKLQNRVSSWCSVRLDKK